MDAYVLGNHEGELPTHLLAQGELGNRVRVMANLVGPAHNAYYAIEAPDDAALEHHVTSLTTSGLTVTDLLPVCTTPPCLQGNDGVSHLPCFLPPFEFHIFIVLRTATIEPTIPEVIERLGRDHVAAANDGNGTFIVELAGDDAQEIEAAARDFLESAAAESTGLHTVSVEGLIKA